MWKIKQNVVIVNLIKIIWTPEGEAKIIYLGPPYEVSRLKYLVAWWAKSNQSAPVVVFYTFLQICSLNVWF